MVLLPTLAIMLALLLGSTGVSGSISRVQKVRRSPNDAIFFPGSNSRRFQSSRLTERPERDDSSFHGPQNGFGGNGAWPSPWGNNNFNSRPNNFNSRPNNFPRAPEGGNQPNWEQGGNQPNWGQGGNQNQPWGNGGGNFNRPGDDESGEAFVFDRPPPNRPGNGAGARPPPARPGNGGGAFPPPPGRPGNGGGSRPIARPTTAAPNRPTMAGGRVTTTLPPATSPTAASTRPGCNCPSTPEFNPVCGQDSVTYSNPGKLRCANVCGNNVVLKHYGACIRVTTPAAGRR